MADENYAQLLSMLHEPASIAGILAETLNGGTGPGTRRSGRVRVER